MTGKNFFISSFWLCESGTATEIPVFSYLYIMHKKPWKNLQKNGYRNTLKGQNPIQITQNTFFEFIN
jgi:hypothetical protein